jgi:hypothetical protein
MDIKAHDPDQDPMTVTWYINKEIVRAEGIGPSVKGGNSSVDLMAPYENVNGIDVKVVVSDGRLSAEQGWRFNVTSPSNTPPVAVITIEPKVPKKGKAVTFDGSASHDLEGDIITYEWRFSDGTTATGKEVTKTFDQKAIVTATLIVTDSKGNTGETSKVLSFGGSKIQSASEGPWALIAFVLLLVIFVALLVYQSFKKGWIGRPKADDEGPEDYAPLEGDVTERPAGKEVPKEEGIEGPFEEVGPDEHGEDGIEELPVDEEK